MLKKIKTQPSLNKFEKLLDIYIIIQPIIDIITSLCVRNISSTLTFGIFIRTIFMLFIMIYTLVKIDKKSKLKLLIYYTLIALYCIIFIINSYTHYGLSMIFNQFKGLVKTFYLPIILSSVLMLFKFKGYSTKIKYLNIALILYVLPVVICKLFSIGYPTYPLGGSLGSIGLFYAGNELSALLALLAPLCFALFIKNKFNILNALVCIFTVFAMLEIGTKVACVSIVVLLLLAFIVSIITFIKDKKNYKQFISIFIMIILTGLFMGNTSAGKNLGISPILSCHTFNSYPGHNTTENKKPYIDNQYIDNPSIDNPVTLLSGRNLFFKDTLKGYNESSITSKIIGLGYINNNSATITESKLIEIDFFDIFFCHGILGALIYIIPLVIAASVAIRSFFANYKNIIKNCTSFFIIFSILLSLGIALIAGHVFTAPAVSFNLIIIIYEAINLFKFTGGENGK